MHQKHTYSYDKQRKKIPMDFNGIRVHIYIFYNIIIIIIWYGNIEFVGRYHHHHHFYHYDAPLCMCVREVEREREDFAKSRDMAHTGTHFWLPCRIAPLIFNINMIFIYYSHSTSLYIHCIYTWYVYLCKYNLYHSNDDNNVHKHIYIILYYIMHDSRFTIIIFPSKRSRGSSKQKKIYVKIRTKYLMNCMNLYVMYEYICRIVHFFRLRWTPFDLNSCCTNIKYMYYHYYCIRGFF